ncbi:hypothetical protein [Embleya sp. NPDC050493]|uniref:hypothetical protein n=1 Tax=Embleya sp. NPDC050493 TaxID=3363989 RepID=UPI0037A823BE
MLDSGAGLPNATLQQHLVPVRLFYDHLVEEGVRASNPVGRGRYTPSRALDGNQRRLVPRLKKLPWIPSERQWLDLLDVAREEPVHNRLMLALPGEVGRLAGGAVDRPDRRVGRAAGPQGVFWVSGKALTGAGPREGALTCAVRRDDPRIPDFVVFVALISCVN